jgi:hypothetical protein
MIEKAPKGGEATSEVPRSRGLGDIKALYRLDKEDQWSTFEQ